MFIIIYTNAEKYPNCPSYLVLLFLEEQINCSLSLLERKENVWGGQDGVSTYQRKVLKRGGKKIDN
jgi:hypothetical protein